MKLQIFLLFFFISILSAQPFFGQDSEENPAPLEWLMEYQIYRRQPVFPRYDRYSKEDAAKFREKLELLKNAEYKDEWEGVYDRGVGSDVGIASLHLDSEAGFVDFYIYTCFPELRHINYGKVSNTPEYILITPEFAMDSPRKSEPVKYVKIRWNDRHYLVEESSLAAFAEKIAGVFVEPADSDDENYQKWTNYWVKGDTEKELTGWPEFPAGYKNFQRFPIEAKILSVGKRTIEEEVETARWVSGGETAVYRVKIGAGFEKGVKKGLVFEVPETGDEILITEVYRDYAAGIIGRQIDENKNDQCLDDDSNKIACPKIKSSFKVKTAAGGF